MARSRSLLTAAAATAALTGALLLGGAPASAHDELVASSPEAGAALSSAPTQVTLQYSADVLTMGAVVVVVDETGTDWAAGEPALVGNEMTVNVDPDMPEGGYEVRWRVVSSDGHPISGIVPFTVGDAEPLVREPAVAEASDGSVTDERTAQDQIESENGPWRVVLLGAAGASIAGGLFALVLFFLRRRQTHVGSGHPDE